MARRPAAARSDRDPRRCDGGNLFGVSHRGGRHGLDLPGAERGFRRARPADEPLHRSRRALFSSAEAGRSTASRRPKWAAPWSNSASSISGPIRRRRAGARSGRSRRLQDRLVNELKLAGIVSIAAANAFLRDVYLPEHNARFAVPAGEARPSRRSRASTSTRSCACKRSAKSATTIRVVPHA